MTSWSWICNVCWCAVHGGDFHPSTACHKHISKSVDIKINQAQAEEQEGNNRDLNIPVWMDICIPMLLNTRTSKRANKHTKIWTTYRWMPRSYSPRATERLQSAGSLSSSPGKCLHPKGSSLSSCVCVPVCFQRDALKMLPTASPCFIKGSETQHTEKKH